MSKRSTLVAAVAAVSLGAAAVTGAVVATSAEAATPKLVATVGPGFTITLKTASGAPAKIVKAGTYTIVVNDRSDDHNFALSGRGVRKSSSVDATGTTTWRVRLSPGVYKFWCAPHADGMKGSFRVR